LPTSPSSKKTDPGLAGVLFFWTVLSYWLDDFEQQAAFVVASTGFLLTRTTV